MGVIVNWKRTEDLPNIVLYFPDHRVHLIIRRTKLVEGKFRDKLLYSHIKLKFTNTYSTKWQCSIKSQHFLVSLSSMSHPLLLCDLYFLQTVHHPVPSKLSHIYRQTSQLFCIPQSIPLHKSVIQRSCPSKISDAACNLPSFHFMLQKSSHSFGLVSSSSLLLPVRQ